MPVDPSTIFPRHISRRIGAARKTFPVILVHGARQVGKTTLVRLAAAGGPRWPEADPVPPSRALATITRYRTLDDPASLEAARTDPTEFVKRFDSPDWTVIDEVQRGGSALLLAIKRSVDEDRRPGRFLLTGSSDPAMLPSASEALAGRVAIVDVRPLAQVEIARTQATFLENVFSRTLPMWSSSDVRASAVGRATIGGYPEIVRLEDELDRLDWFTNYLTTVVAREANDLQRVGDDLAIPRILEHVALRATGPLNVAALASDTGYSRTNVDRYLGLLERIFLVTPVPAWRSRRSATLRKGQKYILSDSGLAAHILRVRDDRAKLGSVVEQFVGGELLKHIGWERNPYSLYYFRTQQGEEVDFVLEAPDQKVVGIEVKLSSTVAGSDLGGLRKLAELTGDRFRRGIILYTGEQTLPFGRDFAAVPISALWSEPIP